MRFNGQAVQDEDTLTVAMNSYRAVGGGNYAFINRHQLFLVMIGRTKNCHPAYLNASAAPNRPTTRLQPEKIEQIDCCA